MGIKAASIVALLVLSGLPVTAARADDGDPVGGKTGDGARVKGSKTTSWQERTHGTIGGSGESDGQAGRRGRSSKRTTKISVPVDKPEYCDDGSLKLDWGCAELPSKIQIGDEVEPDKPGKPPRPPQPRRPRPERITIQHVEEETKQVAFPKLAVRIQPTGRLTLVNLDTNVYTVPVPFERTVQVLTWPVTVRATPTSYTWHFGDGTHETTTGPGAPIPNHTVTHQYKRRGPVRVSVTVNYEARFRVPGRAWQSIPGTVSINGPATALFACEARPVLVDPDNPNDGPATEADPNNPCTRRR